VRCAHCGGALREGRCLECGREAKGIAPISKHLGDAIYGAYEKRLRGEVMKGPIPQHIAVIMDGNRRAAEELGHDKLEGHEFGRETLEKMLEWCLEIGVKHITVYAFSTENLKRAPEEVQHLARLFAENFRKAGDDERVHKYKIRIQALGRVEMLPEEVQKSIRYAEERTKHYSGYFFNIAVAYGGRDELLRAFRSIAEDVKRGKMSPDEIDESAISSRLYTKDMPDPDLIIRTSGEERISNFLLWQNAYAELYFTDVFWPAFRKVDFLRAVREYQMRKRRFGK
jgi:tritrans,polycis-undecaprenyl-diphosphate synthase [geranylgeranyl-diphosphate specific]